MAAVSAYYHHSSSSCSRMDRVITFSMLLIVLVLLLFTTLFTSCSSCSSNRDSKTARMPNAAVWLQPTTSRRCRLLQQRTWLLLGSSSCRCIADSSQRRNLVYTSLAAQLA